MVRSHTRDGHLRRRRPEHPRDHRVLVLALAAICVVGTLASVSAAVIGLVPPSQAGQANVPLYVVGLLTAVPADRCASADPAPPPAPARVEERRSTVAGRDSGGEWREFGEDEGMAAGVDALLDALRRDQPADLAIERSPGIVEVKVGPQAIRSR